MRWIAILAVSLVLTGSVLAAGSDEQYLDIYNEILQADSLLQSDHAEAAAHRYLQAQIDLQKLQAEHPSWNPDIVKFRIDYLAEKLQALGKYLPTSNAPPVTVSAPAQSGGVVQPAAPAAGPAIAALEQRNAGLQEQVRTLNSANAELQGKLKEALSVQPAAVSPTELTKAEERIVSLQKERDLLAVALEQEKSSNASAIAAAKAAAVDQAVAEVKARDAAELQRAQEEIAKFKAAAAESEKKLAAATKELEALKEARALEADQNAALKARTDAEALKSQEEVARLKEAGAESAKILAAARKELETLKAKRPTDLELAEDGKHILEERDQLKQSLAQISNDEAEITRLKAAVADAEQKLAAANSELESLKAERATTAQSAADAAKAVTEERDKLKAELAQRSKDLADAEAHHNEELLAVRTALQQAEQRRDELEKKLAAASQAQLAVPPPTAPVPVSAAPTATPLETPAAPAPAATAATAPETPATPPPTTSGTPVPATAPETPSAPAPTATDATAPTPAPVTTSASAQPGDTQSTLKMEQLQARVAVLEAKPVPYTPEELALLKMSPATTPAELPKPVLRPGHVHSNKDLPPGSGALWAEALRASMAGDFDTAEQKYKEVLDQDETNVYVLAFLANAQFAAGHLANCEKSVKQALAVDPEDPGSLYLLGLLRYRQDKLDEALDALSLSAKINPTNAATQNFLGCVLADKGLRPAAETALRKALQSDPDYADAHFNLAVVYADNQPPSWELARWHYKKAVALGHAKSPTLDKLLGENQ